MRTRWLSVGVAASAAVWVAVAASSASAAAVIRTIPVAAGPHAVSSDGTHVWVVSDDPQTNNGTLSEIDAATGKVTAIAVGSYAYGVSSDGTHVWVTSEGDNMVREIDAATGKVTAIAVGLYPSSVSSDGTHVWVANIGDYPHSNGTVTELDAATGTVVRTIPVGSSPYGVSSDGTRVWVANAGDSTVTEIDAATGTVLKTISVCSAPEGISSDGTHVWVANQFCTAISEITAASGAVVDIPVETGKPGTGGIFDVSSDGTHVWVPLTDGTNAVKELDAASGGSDGSITVGKSPTGISSDGAHVWVANYTSDTVSEIQIGPVTPTVSVTDNTSGLSPGSGLVFTATVGEAGGGVTPTEAVMWDVKAPGGASVPCDSSSGPSGSSDVATYTCTIAVAVAGSYVATAAYSGDSNFTPGSGTDNSASVLPVTLIQGPPVAATALKGNGYSTQLSVTNAFGQVTYAENSSAASAVVQVGAAGTIHVDSTTAPGTYTIGGTDSDSVGDTGIWSFTLTVVTPDVVLSGSVQNRYGKGIPSVPLSIDDGSSTQFAMTDDSGTYSATVPSGSYTVTPYPADGRYTPQASADCTVQAASCVIEAVGSAVNANFQMNRLPVVLVTGIHDEHAGMTPAGVCSSVGDMENICNALKNQKFPVYVASASSVPGAAVINPTVTFDVNAASLATYLARTVGGPALLVGHSNGGITSRVAISKYHASAAGLFAIGSAFTGSFAADLEEAAAYLPSCSAFSSPKVCTFLKDHATIAQDSFGAAALADLTSEARGAENQTLTAPGVRTWTFAGTACDPDPTDQTRYFSPNDGVVGLSSAFGDASAVGPSANLGSTTQYQGADYHASILQHSLPCGTLLNDFPNELDDPLVAARVVSAAQLLDRLFPAGANLRRGSGDARASTASVKQVPVVVYLQRAAVRSLRRGSSISMPPGTSLLSATGFALQCGGRKIDALPSIDGRIFGFPPGALPCTRATLLGSHPIKTVIASDPDRVRVTIVSRHEDRFAITITASRAINRLVLSHGRHTLRLARHRLGRRAIRVNLTGAEATGLTLTATVAHSRYTATISALS